MASCMVQGLSRLLRPLSTYQTQRLQSAGQPGHPYNLHLCPGMSLPGGRQGSGRASLEDHCASLLTLLLIALKVLVDDGYCQQYACVAQRTYAACLPSTLLYLHRGSGSTSKAALLGLAVLTDAMCYQIDESDRRCSSKNGSQS